VKRSFIKAVQFHPVTDRIIHTDFQLFAADEVIEMDVPVTVTGESIGVDKGGKLQILRHNLTLKGKPADMPDHLVIDVTEMQIGSIVHVKDIPAESYKNLEIILDPETPVVSVVAPKVEVETEETPEAAAPETEE